MSEQVPRQGRRDTRGQLRLPTTARDARQLGLRAARSQESPLPGVITAGELGGGGEELTTSGVVGGGGGELRAGPVES